MQSQSTTSNNQIRQKCVMQNVTKKVLPVELDLLPVRSFSFALILSPTFAYSFSLTSNMTFAFAQLQSDFVCSVELWPTAVTCQIGFAESTCARSSSQTNVQSDDRKSDQPLIVLLSSCCLAFDCARSTRNIFFSLTNPKSFIFYPPMKNNHERRAVRLQSRRLKVRPKCPELSRKQFNLARIRPFRTFVLAAATRSQADESDRNQSSSKCA
jgi:hypothetical protein